MGIKSNVFGLIGAAALSLSMIAGAGAAETNTNVRVTVSGSQCTIGASASNIWLGTWKWDGIEYVFEDGAKTGVITWDIKSGNPTGCNGTLEVTQPELIGTTTTGLPTEIGLENFDGKLEYRSSYKSGGSLQYTPFSDLTNGFETMDPGSPWTDGQLLQTGQVRGSLKLNQVPDVAPGKYLGTVKATVTNGQ